MFYQTRHLEALRQIEHGGYLIKTGDRFPCSPTDADYYIAKGHAREVEDAPAPVAAPQAAPELAPPTRRRRTFEQPPKESENPTVEG